MLEIIGQVTPAFILGGVDTIHSFTVAAGIAELTNSLRDFLAPIVLIITSVLAITFLIKREMMKFVTFVIIAIIVFAIFYAPEMLSSLGKSFGDKNKDIKFE